MLSKAWFDEQNEIYNEKLLNAIDDFEVQRYQGVLFGLKIAYERLIETSKSPKEKEFNYEKTFKKILEYYIKEKNYSPEQANNIAIKIANEQQEAWKQKQR